MSKFYRSILPLFFLLPTFLTAQVSVAHQWSEALLEAIRNDFARPTVHARNLFHTSVGMYDAWALYDEEAETFFVGKTIGEFSCPPVTLAAVTDSTAAQEMALSYAAYRLLSSRFSRSPGRTVSLAAFTNLMLSLGYDPQFTSTDFANDGPAALGNYIAENLILFGLQDNANEQNDYENQVYQPVNPPLIVQQPANPTIVDPNRWQPLTLTVFIDQSGNVRPGDTPPFLSPEWGSVVPFALTATERTVLERDGLQWSVYYDPGVPPYLDTENASGLSAEYQWGFALVAAWSAHLSPDDGTFWDISPGAIGNIREDQYPTTVTELRDFYQLEEGGDIGTGHAINPTTGQAYEPQLVPRGDYARILAEFWADGPDSETPPGHWFTILNYVSEHPELRKQFAGIGEELPALEWDVKAYLTLGGAMHDAAVTVWGIKGYYDYLRPVSAIRMMGDFGQSTDPTGPSYHPAGLPLIANFIEVVQPGDPLAGNNNENVGKMKLRAWRGPDYIQSPATQTAGVGWILSEEWWPYQRPTFVSPNFAGYVSGHSTFSRAAAEVLTALTGDPFFPGGMGRFSAPRNEFLVFEDGPSQDLELQWATYRDASDQCSLSRIWGGIHPPVDDIPGRLIGIQVGRKAFALAKSLFYKDEDQDGFYSYEDCDDTKANVYPGAPEICDGLDNNCDGDIDEGVQLTFYLDNDVDGFGDATQTVLACSAPDGFVANNEDCNDGDANEYPGQQWYLDVDMDGFSAGQIVTACVRPDNGYLQTELNGSDLDCDDDNAQFFPGQEWYLDQDADGYSDGQVVVACARPDNGFLQPELLGTAPDCDDTNDQFFPGQVWFVDVDGDGYSSGEQIVSCSQPTSGILEAALLGVEIDCNDMLPQVFPGGEEFCDGLDNNCDGLIDEDLPLFTYYRDADGDGFGDINTPIDTCRQEPPQGYVINADDCVDNNSDIYLGAPEIADNGIDEDCNGVDLFLRTKFFPNPVRQELTIHLANSGRVRWQLFDMQGRLVREESSLFVNNRLTIDCSQLRAGTYLWVLYQELSGKRLLQEKIIKG